MTKCDSGIDNNWKLEYMGKRGEITLNKNRKQIFPKSNFRRNIKIWKNI